MAEQLLLTPEQAAQALAVGRNRVFQLMASGELGSIKIAKSRRIPMDAVRAYVAGLIQQETQTTGTGVAEGDEPDDRDTHS